MKLLLTTIICLTISMNSLLPQTDELQQSFSVDRHISALQADLNGKITWITWDFPEVKVETSIQTKLADPYVLAYQIRKGHFQLVSSYQDAYTLRIASKRINSSIYQKGRSQSCELSFKIYAPAHLHPSEGAASLPN